MVWNSNRYIISVVPRLKRPHKSDTSYFPCDPSIPIERQRAVYTRLSDRRDDPESISHDQQEKADRQYAESHGFVVTAVYRDWRTGFDPNRVGFRQLVADAHAGRHG